MRALALLLLLAALIVLPPAVQAQDSPLNSATFTEAFINAAVQAHQSPDADLTDLFIDLRPGQIVLSGTVQAPQGPVALSLALAVSVENGQMNLAATAISLGGITLDLNEWARSGSGGGAVNDLRLVVGEAAQGNRIESLSVTDTTLTLTWQRSDPDAPILAVVDNTVSLTVSQDAFNALPWVANPPNSRLTNVSVDFQPGQLVITATRLEPDNSSRPVSITAVPTLFGGLVTWSITAMVVGETPQDATQIGQINDDIAGSWRAYFNGLYHSGKLSNLVLTGDSMTLTWDGSLSQDLGFEPGSASLVISEDTINGSLRVTNPASYSISDVVVDLQPGQAVLTAHLNLRSGRVLVEQATFVPSTANGILYWTVASATLDGVPLDPATIDRYNDAVTGWWSMATWGEFAEYFVTSVTISDTEITITARPR